MKILGKMRLRFRLASWACAFAGVLSSAGSARADNPFLGVAASYNQFVLGTDTQTLGGVDGKLAVGDKSTLRTFSVGSSLPANNPGVVMVEGGNLTYVDLNANGIVNYAGQLTTNLADPAPNVVQVNPAIIDFHAAGTFLQNLSTSQSIYAATGFTLLSTGRIDLVGTSDVNYFNVSGSDLSAANVLNIDIVNHPGARVIVNFSGTTDVFSANVTIKGTTANNVLFNFPLTSNLTLMNTTVEGSILAPYTVITGTDSIVNGNLIAGTLRGRNVVASSARGLFSSASGGGFQLQAVPEPASICLLGMGAAGFGLRSFRRTKKIKNG